MALDARPYHHQRASITIFGEVGLIDGRGSPGQRQKLPQKDQDGVRLSVRLDPREVVKNGPTGVVDRGHIVVREILLAQRGDELVEIAAG